MYSLIAVIEGNHEEQGHYTQLNHALSRIMQLDVEYEFLERPRPMEYKIIVLQD